MTKPTTAEIRKYLDKYAYTAGFPSDMAKVILDRLEAAEAELKDITFQRNTAYKLLNENDLLDYDLIMAKANE